MTDYKPGETVPREDLREGWRVRVEFEGEARAGVAGGWTLHAPSREGATVFNWQFEHASRIVLLDKSAPDAEIVEALAEGMEQSGWTIEVARMQRALLREKGYLT